LLLKLAVVFVVQAVAVVLVAVVWGIPGELAKPVIVWTAFEEAGDVIGVSRLSSVVIVDVVLVVDVDDTPKNEGCCGRCSSSTGGKSDSWGGRCSEVVDIAESSLLLLLLLLLPLFHDAHRWRCCLALLFLLRGRPLLGLGVAVVESSISVLP
jgi:hypothetical protein